jgi:hypothetical protein
MLEEGNIYIFWSHDFDALSKSPQQYVEAKKNNNNKIRAPLHIQSITLPVFTSGVLASSTRSDGLG